MKILAIETSCDETAISLMEASGGLVKPKFKILKSLVASQIKIHQPFGGVVPNLAKREHVKNLPVLLRKIFANPKPEIRNSKQTQNSKFKIPNIDLIAVTVGPGLEPALWAGIEFAKQIHAELRGLHADLRRKRILADQCSSQRKSTSMLAGVNHLEGHLYSFLLPQKRVNSKHEARNTKNGNFEFRLPAVALAQAGVSNLGFPAVSLLVSGGHTELLLMKDMETVTKLGETRDDAVGECFDKVARMLKLPYPGGPEVEKLAKKGSAEAITFPRPMLDQKNYDFSFSGLKTAVLYYLRDKSTNSEFNTNKRINEFAYSYIRTDSLFADLAASFQKAAIDVLITKTMRAAREYGAKSIMVSGGVAANKELRRRFTEEAKRFKNLKLVIPDFKYCTDNADMIAAAAYMNVLRGKQYPLEAKGNLDL